jgi:hypothetical protein
MSLCFRLIAVEFAGSPKRSMNRKTANMGIAGVEPHQLAPTMGTTGSGSTDSPAPSPIIDNLTASTRLGGPASAMAVDSASLLDIDPAIDAATVIAVPAVINTNDKIDIDFAIDTAVDIAVPSIISTTSLEPEVDIAGSTVTGTASPSDASLIPAAIIVDPTSGTNVYARVCSCRQCWASKCRGL